MAERRERFERPARRQPASPCIGVGMVTRRVLMPARDVVFFKGVIEASEGLAAVFAEHGGDVLVAAPEDRSAELDGVLADLCAQIGAVRSS
jgi:hypothetical protein